MKRLLLVAVTFGAISLPVAITIAQQPGEQPFDKRYGPPKTLNDYFPFTPPKTRPEWERRKEELRQQVLVANGLWPMPEKTPIVYGDYLYSINVSGIVGCYDARTGARQYFKRLEHGDVAARVVLDFSTAEQFATRSSPATELVHA